MSALVVDAIPRTAISPRLDLLLAKDNLLPPTKQPTPRPKQSVTSNTSAIKGGAAKRTPSARMDAPPSLTSQREQHLTLLLAAIEQEQQEWADHRAMLGLGPGAACIFTIPDAQQELVEQSTASDIHVQTLLSETYHALGSQSVEVQGYRLERERYVPRPAHIMQRRAFHDMLFFMLSFCCGGGCIVTSRLCRVVCACVCVSCQECCHVKLDSSFLARSGRSCRRDSHFHLRP